jgi:hypothetical protein
MTPTIEGDDPTGRPARRRPNGPVRWVAAAAAVGLVAGLLWTRGGSHQPTSPALDRALRGTLVYATAGADGVTGRLWRVHLSTGEAVRGPRTLLPDEIVASGPGETWVGVRSGGTAYVFRDLSSDGSPLLLADGQLTAWAPGGNAVFVVTRDASARGRCPNFRLSFVDSMSHGEAVVYEAPTCSTVDGLGVDGLTRPFVSLDGPTDAGVYELGYKQFHLVVPDFALLAVSPVGDMLVGPRVAVPTGPNAGAAPILRTLLVWQGVGGPTVIGTPDEDLRAERFLAWSEDGHLAAILGTLGGVRSVWILKAVPGEGRRRPQQVAPELPAQVGSVGAAFAGETLMVAAAGKLYASVGRGYREIDLPDGAPPPSGPLLWLDR